MNFQLDTVKPQLITHFRPTLNSYARPQTRKRAANGCEHGRFQKCRAKFEYTFLKIPFSDDNYSKIDETERNR